jgi:hypothetical protein
MENNFNAFFESYETSKEIMAKDNALNVKAAVT